MQLFASEFRGYQPNNKPNSLCVSANDHDYWLSVRYNNSMTKQRIVTLAPLVPILIAFIIGSIAFPYLPETLATHWNLHGQADGYGGKFAGVWLLPLLMLAVYGLLSFIPSLDPKGKNVEKFSSSWRLFQLNLQVFFLWVYTMTLFWNLGIAFDMTRSMAIGFAYLFIALGLLVSHTEQNWFIGIRTPWTLENKDVWRRTHRLGARFFFGLGGLALISFFWPIATYWIVIGGIILATVALFAYSYIIFRESTARNIKK